MHPRKTTRLAAVLALVAGAVACDRDEVTKFRVPKAPAAQPMAVPAGMGMAGCQCRYSALAVVRALMRSASACPRRRLRLTTVM